MKKILVVEDEPDIQELLGAYLRDTGYDVEIVGDGVAALDRFQKGTFDLILLDLMLPKIDGFGVGADAPSPGISTKLCFFPLQPGRIMI